MKVALLVYHKNAIDLYPNSWIEEFKLSIDQQTYKEFDIFELNYGSDNFRIFDNSKYYKVELDNHIHAMNILIDHILLNGYDIIANTNIDDIYHECRLEKQIEAIESGYDLVSSNFLYVGEKSQMMQMSKYNIEKELNKGHNVICHPLVVTHRRFWEDKLEYKNLLGKEDLDLWQRAIKLGRKFTILEDYLLKYRIHSNQVTKTWKK